MIIPEILRTNAYQQRRVTIFGIPGMVAHTIYNYAAMLGCGSDYMTAGTHTEGIDATAVRGMTGQLI